MTVLRCTAKLLKQPTPPAEPQPQASPLGKWYLRYCLNLCPNDRRR